MKNVKILIIAGGGIFGIIPIVFLKEVRVRKQIFIYNKLNILAGTSIGGITALYLAQDKNPIDLYTSFMNGVGTIFNESFFRSWNPFLSKYSANNIEPFLKKELQGKYGDLKIPVIIPTLNFKDDKPKIFDNIRNINDNMDIWKIGRATSAAPTYFPPYGDDILLDGGIVENLPVMTVASCVKSKMGIPYSDMDVFVLGTGYKVNKEKTEKDVKSYSTIQWLKNLLIPYVTKSNEITSNYWANFMGFKSYTYFNPVKIEGEMDEANQVTSGKLERDCQGFIPEFKQKWKEFINL